ncbi:hypothetical protein T265_02117 [Opisthorchis viverrini]|uniref:Uncharacterized protein n=1 Tax=Opisthorchis viverrini TaxID=6198 RepID=A0A075A0I6_OPIVI|nr:hypothetical protein T265_02117 [Opisthorchis viverrini]KER31757.1 hypothetical protein T265_02117 [Opisthorchis viverrini]
MVRIRPPPLDCSCLGLDNLAVSQPWCFLRVAWQLGTERVLQLKDFFENVGVHILYCNIGFEFHPIEATHRCTSLIVTEREKYANWYIWTRKRVLLPIECRYSETSNCLNNPAVRFDVRDNHQKSSIVLRAGCERCSHIQSLCRNIMNPRVPLSQFQQNYSSIKLAEDEHFRTKKTSD